MQYPQLALVEACRTKPKSAFRIVPVEVHFAVKQPSTYTGCGIYCANCSLQRWCHLVVGAGAGVGAGVGAGAGAVAVAVAGVVAIVFVVVVVVIAVCCNITY